MQSNESPLSTTTAIDAKISPLHPRNLFNLFFRPRRFFEQLNTFQHQPYIYLCAWLYGATSVKDRLERFSFDDPGSVTFEFWSMVSNAWLQYWLWILVFGVASGCITWIIGGWWYRKRIGWAGESDADPYVVRLIYFYSSVVITIPVLLQLLIDTLIYPNYSTAYALASPYTALAIIFPFWSVVVGYIGVRTCSRQ
jgi:hypothetical protein